MNELLLNLKRIYNDSGSDIARLPNFALTVYKQLPEQEQEFIGSLFYQYESFGYDDPVNLSVLPNYATQNSLLYQLGLVEYTPTMTYVSLLFLSSLDTALSSIDLNRPQRLYQLYPQPHYKPYKQIPLFYLFLYYQDHFKLQQKFEIDANQFSLSSSRDYTSGLIYKMVGFIKQKPDDFRNLIQQSAAHLSVLDASSQYDYLQFIEFVLFLVNLQPQKTLTVKTQEFKALAPFFQIFALLDLLHFEQTQFKTTVFTVSDDVQFLQFPGYFLYKSYDDFLFVQYDIYTTNCLSLESTGRIYCYKNGPKQLLSLFCEPVYTLPHMTVFEINRALLKKNKIDAVLACRFLQENLRYGRVFPPDLANLIASFEDRQDVVYLSVCKVIFIDDDKWLLRVSRIAFWWLVDFCRAKGCLIAYSSDEYDAKKRDYERIKRLYGENKNDDTYLSRIRNLEAKLRITNKPFIVFKSEYKSQVDEEYAKIVDRFKISGYRK